IMNQNPLVVKVEANHVIPWHGLAGDPVTKNDGVGLGLQTRLFKKPPSYGFVPAGNVRMSGRLANDDRPGYERHQRLEEFLGICRPSLLEQWRHHSLHCRKMPGNLRADLRLFSLRAELG